jgi:hypothetical protein
MSVTDLGRFFRDQYAVGSESAFLTMPVTVLADLGARGAALTERALAGSGEMGATLRDNGLYRLIVRLPLRSMVELAAFLRRSPQYRVSLVIGCLLYVLLAIVANFLLGGTLYQHDGFGRPVALVAFAVLPLTALLAAWVFWRSRIGKRVLVAAVVVGVAAATYWQWDVIFGYLNDKCVQSCEKLPKRALPGSRADGESGGR